MGNTVEPDQMLHSLAKKNAASDLGVHCLLRPVCHTMGKYRVNTITLGKMLFSNKKYQYFLISP